MRRKKSQEKNKEAVKTYLNDETITHLKKLAVFNNMSISCTLRNIILDYIKLKGVE